MDQIFSRLEILFGPQAMRKLAYSRVLVAGLGGVGSWCLEALARSGLGSLVLVDSDLYEPTNLNRQLFATQDTLGQAKVLAGQKRLLSINPQLDIITKQVFLNQDSLDELLDETHPDFVIDAIDSIQGKGQLIASTSTQNIPFVCCLGTARKKDPTRFHIISLSQTHTCPLARALRLFVRQHNLPEDVPCVFSDEVFTTYPEITTTSSTEKVLGSYVAVVATAGFLAADYCIKKIIAPF